MQARAPATTSPSERLAAGREREHGAVVDRVGVAVEQLGRARERRGDRRRSPRRPGPSEKFGTASSHALSPQPPTSSSPSRTSGSPSTLTSASSTTQSRWTGTWTVPPIAAEAPKATWQVPRIFSSSSSSPVSSRLLVGADPELGDVGPVLAVGRRAAPAAAHPPRPTAAVRWPASTVSSTGSRDAADRGDRPVDDQGALARALDRGDEALAAGQVAEGAGRGQVAGVGDRLAVAEPEPQVGAVGAGDPRLGAAR